MGFRLIPFSLLRGRGLPTARHTTIAVGLQHQKDRAIEDWQVTQHQLFSIAEELCGPRATLVANREMLCVLNLERDFSLCQHGVYDASLRQRQQSIE
jgi:hypothetical protein